MSTDYASYTSLNTYVLLAHTALKSVTNTTVNSNPPYVAGNYGIDGLPSAVTGPYSGVTLDNTNAGSAQTNLGNLITAVNALPSTAPFPAITSAITLTPNVYIIPGGLTLTSSTITFNGHGQYVINSSNGISITTCDFVLANGAIPSDIIWYAGSNTSITVTGSPVLATPIPGIFIATASITATDSTITGNLYANTQATSTTRVTINPLTLNPLTLCYLRGTLILTKNGYVAIEDLSVGDKVVRCGQILDNMDVIFTDELKPITWISNFYATVMDETSFPICFKKDCFKENVPFDDLFVSPGHRIILDGEMHIARDLINGDSIIQDTSIENIEYFHFELESHSVVDATGILAETFLEIDDFKSVFQL